MTALTPFLLFDGNCRQAMEFYRFCLGGELILTVVKDTPAKERIPASQHDKVLNARLKGSNVDVSASDWLRPHRTRVRGNTVFSVSAEGHMRNYGRYSKNSPRGARSRIL